MLNADCLETWQGGFERNITVLDSGLPLPFLKQE